MPCPICGERMRVWASRLRKAKLPVTCGRACRSAMMSRERNPRWTGGRWIDSQGYVIVNVPERGPTREHHLVVEACMGRRLRPDEMVHHRDGDKQNNRPSNLEVRAGRVEHGRLHARAAVRDAGGRYTARAR